MNNKMVKAIVNLTLFGKEILEPELRLDFIVELLEAQNEKTIKVKDFSNHYK